MRFAIKEDTREQWNRWFAWHPVTIGGARVWLEFVERREVYIACHPCGEFAWEYRQ